MKNSLCVFVCCVIVVFLVDSVYSSSSDNADLAKQAQNPVANLISLPFKTIPILVSGPIMKHKTF